jgi:hypothetical protein
MQRLVVSVVSVIVLLPCVLRATHLPREKVILGAWRIHIPQRADRIVIFHADGSWGVRNWDFSQPEDIRGRRWRIDRDSLIITPPPADSGETFSEHIISFSHRKIVTEINGTRISYTRMKLPPNA